VARWGGDRQQVGKGEGGGREGGGGLTKTPFHWEGEKEGGHRGREKKKAKLGFDVTAALDGPSKNCIVQFRASTHAASFKPVLA